MPPPMPRPSLPPPAALLALFLLPGCQAVLTETTATVAGIGGAGIADGLGANAALTTGIGLGVQAIGRAGLQYAQRLTHRAGQNRIAAAAGPLPVGGVGSWTTDHTIPVEPNEHGQVAVSRVISTGPLECKEIVFSVDTGQDETLQRSFFLAAICRNGNVMHVDIACRVCDARHISDVVTSFCPRRHSRIVAFGRSRSIGHRVRGGLLKSPQLKL